MATTALPRNSRRLFMRDRRTNVTFLIDTGSDVSIIPATKTQRQNNSQMTLSAANTSPIHVYTTQTLSLDLGLRRIFQWTFLVGNVSTPIIGADFLYNFRLVPDIIHYIETNSRPVTAKARRLAPDRLRIKAEFENMITLGHMRPSKK
ncbi:transposon Ty3-G Gag-Pol polyprotein [Trichonephila clavipes]|uniref:Transposon Ty3-G Gag-Pol polyprotein n=1 Tax=Trichonephila clavipes TaxID=2585209 RepID=A0A8X6WH88_TRICX|nr:transposon Ty3-G Gag-Pol polyprotein [Trichonephila clavipes]